MRRNDLRLLTKHKPFTDQKTTPHRPGYGCVDHFLAVQVVGKSAIDPTRLIERLQLFGRKLQIETREIVLRSWDTRAAVAIDPSSHPT